MHEMGLCFELMSTLDDLLKREGVKHITSITLDVGEASMVVPRFLLDCWEAAKADTPYKDCVLKLNLTKAHGRCRECDFVFAIVENDRKCPKCGSVDAFDPVDGMEFEISEIETDDN